MDLDALKASLEHASPPEALSAALRALWYQAKGDWDEAHRVAQSQGDTDGAWVHAHLHRVEGDQRNAAYWYRRAGQPVSTASLDEEWDEIAGALL